MAQTIRELHRQAVITAWTSATDAAIESLQAWKRQILQWGECGLVPREEIAAALELLERAGQGEWAEWGAAAGSLDELAEVLSGAE